MGVTSLPPLLGNQAAASDPESHVWLSASAGTGKTQVLAARVFRLLLRGVDPAAILCLTFTKAGAAEMAHRISQRLAAWVRMPVTELGKDLAALGERATSDMQERARTLFARVLDAPGGGVRIQTIHGFCQFLLAAFPIEAGLTPGFRPLEAREEAGLRREALAGMLADAEAQGRERPIEAIGQLSMRLGEGGAESFLHECARALRGLEDLPPGIAPWLRRALDLPAGDIAAYVAERCGTFDEDALIGVAALNRAWGTARGVKRAGDVEAWLALDGAGRAAGLEGFGKQWSTAKGWAPQDEGYAEQASGFRDECAELAALVERGAYADLLAAALEVGRDYARAYADAKRRVGGVDFDDLIATAVALLAREGIGEWVRYKLDQVTEHVLIDEAQDTNLAQWTIVGALVDEFFVGRGIHAPRTRTLFTVGDYKQAIFGFQGTDPNNFAWAERHFAKRAEAVLGDFGTPDDERGLPMARLSLTSSFRSTAPVLEFVDAAVAAVGEPGLGIAAEAEQHASEVKGPGSVTLWPAVVEGGAEDEEEGWIDDAVREVANRVATTLKGWLRDGHMLGAKGRPLRPEDVMILVKRRGDLASLIVARLYAEGVPVAGVDRLRLNAPLAVQDLLAAIRFVLQPGDDLSLASLLVSPLIGWTQDKLMEAAPREGGTLWRHLTETQDAERLAPLRDLLARADLQTPYRFLEEMLSGALDGRRKLIRRLGAEARDPIEELLNAALDFETTATPSLQRFLDWFDRGDVDIVRDAAVAHDAVRVMTAHGAKGLQAPLVILADACVDPTQSPRSVLRWRPEGHDQPVPVFRPRASERGGPLDAVADAAEQRELEEHWRLFYVAATRAEEQLVIAGSLGPRAKGVPPEKSWYAAAARAFDALNVAVGEGDRVFAGSRPQAVVKGNAAAKALPATPALAPGWAYRPAPVEARPPRPLAPSSLGQDEVADPPPTPAMRAAAERGRLQHALFERLPSVPAAERAGAADRWLQRAGGVESASDRQSIAAPVCGILEDPRFAELFGADSLAEAPITAVLADGTVVSGTVDRLLVTADRVQVVDFKTGRQVPADADAVPPYHLRQMAAYLAALRVIFPDRAIEAALLYTAGPSLIVLPFAMLDLAKPDYAAATKPGFADGEQSLALGG